MFKIQIMATYTCNHLLLNNDANYYLYFKTMKSAHYCIHLTSDGDKDESKGNKTVIKTAQIKKIKTEIT